MASTLLANRPIEMVGDCVKLHEVREHPGSRGVHLQGPPTPLLGPCFALLHEECLNHHGHKGDPEVRPGICGAVDERAQVILVWMRPRALETFSPTETRRYKGKAMIYA